MPLAQYSFKIINSARILSSSLKLEEKEEMLKKPSARKTSSRSIQNLIDKFKGDGQTRVHRFENVTLKEATNN